MCYFTSPSTRRIRSEQCSSLHNTARLRPGLTALSPRLRPGAESEQADVEPGGIRHITLLAVRVLRNRCPVVYTPSYDVRSAHKEMDGLREDADVIFILTTNRPDHLEPALASRSGRIDQAIEFPLPREEGRRKLVQLHSGGLDVSPPIMDLLVRRTERASPAFTGGALNLKLLGGSAAESTTK